MKKIPTMFVRSKEKPALVTTEPNPACAWVFNGEGVATRKLDGTACLWKGGKLWKRQEVSARPPSPDDGQNVSPRGTTAPDGKVVCFLPPVADFLAVGCTGPDEKGRYKVQGWVPVGPGPEDQWHRQATFATPMESNQWPLSRLSIWQKGLRPSEGETLELIGPKVNGNPERVSDHFLVLHGTQHPSIPLTLWVFSPGDRSYDGLCSYLRARPMEGIVFWHPDGRMAKIKRRDFGLEWPVKA